MVEGRWLALRIRLAPSGGAAGPDASVVRRVAAMLLDEGASAVHEEGDALVTHLPAPDDPEGLLGRLEERLEGVAGGRAASVESWWERERAWVEEWRSELAPRRVGERLVLAPIGTELALEEGDVVLRLEPGMAFGSGEHGSTRGMLRLLEASLRPGDEVLDAGTGNGVLALLAARLGAGRVVAVDVDPEVLPVARENLRKNGVADAVRLVEARVDTTFLALLSPVRFDLVVANLSARALRPLLAAFRAVVSPGGALIVGGIVLEESGGFRAAVDAAGWRMAGEERDEGWWSARLLDDRAGAAGRYGSGSSSR